MASPVHSRRLAFLTACTALLTACFNPSPPPDENTTSFGPPTTGPVATDDGSTTLPPDTTTSEDDTTTTVDPTTTVGPDTTEDSGSSSTGEPRPYCGDGIIQPELGEECDDGNEFTTDDCPNCMLAVCGDGFHYGALEQCDDGNMSNEDECTNECIPAACGDGFVHQGVEECDDANMMDTDACTNTCTNAVCGDGIVYEGVEDCDDANADPDDGCTAMCTFNGSPQCFMPYTELTTPDRNMAIGAGFRYCDQNNAPDGEFAGPGWYRFTGQAGTQMPEMAPPINSCGTHASGWLNGTHPTPADGVVSRQVCFHWSNNICNWMANIEVVACPGFYLYNLVNAPACQLRYCGE